MPKGDNGKLLAVAFTDLNGNGKFDANKDTLIAKLVDTDHGGKASVGDTVVFGTYPLHLDGTGTGHFTNTTETVTSVPENNQVEIYVLVADGSVAWVSSNFSQIPFEAFIARTPTNEIGTALHDATDSASDVVEVNAAVGPGSPDTSALDVIGSGFGEQPFLDVFVA